MSTNVPALNLAIAMGFLSAAKDEKRSAVAQDQNLSATKPSPHIEQAMWKRSQQKSSQYVKPLSGKHCSKGPR